MSSIIGPISTAASGGISVNPATQVSQRDTLQQSTDSNSAVRLSQASSEKRGEELSESEHKAPRLAPPRVEQGYNPQTLKKKDSVKKSKDEQTEDNPQREQLDVTA